jgi:purine-nucleoside phosphorylase
MVETKDQQVLFCRGAIGASMFADIGYVLCNSRNVEDVIFLGTGGGISHEVQTADVNIPSGCLRLDKVLEIMLPPEAPAKADIELAGQVRKLVEEEMKDVGVTLHDGLHATVPFLLCENKPFLMDLLNQGVLSVDMELSVLYALANHFSKKAVGVIRVDDLPLQGLYLWDAREDQVMLKRRVHTVILRAVLQFVFSK